MPGGPRPTRVQPRPVAELAARVRPVPEVAAGDPDDPGRRLTGVTLDSRAVRPGDLYAALPGSRAHGADFTPQALAAGAAAVLTDPSGRDRAVAAVLAARDAARDAEGDAASGEGPAPVLVVPQPRAALGALAAWLYGEPGSRLLTLGVTGTNGKTTTTFLLDAALRAAGRRTGLVGTVEIRVGEERVVSTGTTPEAPDLHALLALMAERGVDACSMEISSHALAQHRVDGLVVDVAGFTNLSRDHLDFHGSMEDYFAAKAALFTPAHARRGVVCVDDAWGRRLAAAAQVPVTTVTTRAAAGHADRAVDWTVVGSRLDGGLPVVQVLGPARHTPDGPVTVQVPLPGDFNVANAVLALVLLVEAGLDVQDATAALAVAGPVPGRMERVTAATAGADPGAGPAAGAPLAVVDYAHTPDAVAAALRALRDSGSPLVVVLGAGGDRDREKRPLMGEAAADVADVVVVTDDNPRSEDPAAVRAGILEGARRRARATGATVVEVSDRGHAVAEGVARAWGGGVLLVAGKGHEQGQEVAGTVHPFDDRDVLRAALAVAAAESVVASGVARGMREDVR